MSQVISAGWKYSQTRKIYTCVQRFKVIFGHLENIYSIWRMGSIKKNNSNQGHVEVSSLSSTLHHAGWGKSKKYWGWGRGNRQSKGTLTTWKIQSSYPGLYAIVFSSLCDLIPFFSSSSLIVLELQWPLDVLWTHKPVFVSEVNALPQLSP